MDCCCQQLSLTLRLWVTLPAADVCSAGQISHAIFHECIPLIRNQNFFQLCLFLSSSALSPSIHPSTITPPVRPTAQFFLRLAQSENAVAFHLKHVTRPLSHVFSPLPRVFPVSCFETCQGITHLLQNLLLSSITKKNYFQQFQLFFYKKKLLSSITKNLRSWLHCEHQPKIGYWRLLHPPNASSSGHSGALYCQNVKEKNIPLCGHRHTAQHKLRLEKKKKEGVVQRVPGITISAHGIVASTAPSVKDHTSSSPCRAEVCWQKCLCVRHQLLPDFSL